MASAFGLAKSIFEGLGTDGLDEKMQRCALDNKPKVGEDL
jgi:hypothetical protein